MTGLAAIALALGASAGCGAPRPLARGAAERPEPMTCTDYTSPSHIPFACRESELHPSDYPMLDEMAAHLLAQRGLTRVRLIGSQSRTGPEGALPTDLALRRAATVTRELERRGIDPAMIVIVEEESGYRYKHGPRRKSEPDACTDELFDRRRSRRVEVRYTLCCPRRTLDGLTAECPFVPRPE